MLQEPNQIFQYNGSPITFQSGDSVMVNATEMAKPFGKRPAKWLELTSTQDFINTLTAIRNSDTAMVYANSGGDGGGGGTWMHEDVALEFARWLSPTFAIWCNDRIKELLTQGVSTISNDDEAILHAMEVLKRRVEASKQQLQIAEAERDHYREQSAILAPKAEYTDRVLQSTSTLTINQIAQELGMTAVRLNKKLAEKGVQYKQGKTWMLHAQYRDCGYTKMRTYATVNPETGEQNTYQNTVWTEAGRKFIHGLLSA